MGTLRTYTIEEALAVGGMEFYALLSVTVLTWILVAIVQERTTIRCSLLPRYLGRK